MSAPVMCKNVGAEGSKGLVEVGEAGQSAEIGTDWTRVSFTFMADVPQSGFWPLPHYLVQISGRVPLEVDGVDVRIGKDGTDQYQPRRPLEVISDCPDLEGYTVDGNLLEHNADVNIIAHASNLLSKDIPVTLRWQWIDYEGEQALALPVDRPVTLLAGKTLSQIQVMKLTHKGTVLARVQIIAKGNVIDQSDFPITSLPHEKNPTQPDWNERFGGSLRGPLTVGLASKMGFTWSRWYLQTKWHLTQPDGPESWKWQDQEMDLLESKGISGHVVLYGWPKWIMEKGHPLPTDMRWKPDDPRWDDLSIETAWDRYVVKTVEHYRGRLVVFEIENEPELDGWDTYKDAYAKFNIRTARLIKQTNPGAKVMVNNVYGIPSGIKEYAFGAYKKDTQRAVPLGKVILPSDNTSVPFEWAVELTARHELVLVPTLPHHNNGANLNVTGLRVRLVE
ncbi:MAG: hypothetical protein ACI9QL_003137 [Candidatus Omnitrophota bacterium]|jgi:hypothetical protein